MRRPRPGEMLGSGVRLIAASAADCSAFEETARAYLHSVPNLPDPGWDILLVTQALEVPGLDHCPALAQDGRCAIYDNQKPVACAAVPLDPLVPDQLQHLVLAERHMDAAFLGAGCIGNGTQVGLLPLIRGPNICDKQYSEALAERRRQLRADKRFWGRAVFRMLELELFSSPASLARVPTQGYLTMSLAPVLVAVAEVSEHCRARCIEYLESQLALSDHVLQASSTRERLTGSATQLRAFTKTSMALWEALSNGRVLGDGDSHFRDDIAAVEAWLELPQRNHNQCSLPAGEPIGVSDS